MSEVNGELQTCFQQPAALGHWEPSSLHFGHPAQGRRIARLESADLGPKGTALGPKAAQAAQVAKAWS